MRTTVREERMLVVSDVHVGNSLHRPRRLLMQFVRFALGHEYAICVNGDGLDIAQLSLARLNADLTPSIGIFSRFKGPERKIYYTVGNHDIALEHFLSDMGRMMVVPFLNVLSGDKRIRVEHGHTYDSMFLRFPRLYFLFTMIGRLAIGVSAEFYDAIHKINLRFINFSEWVLGGFGRGDDRPKNKNITGIEGERECFGEAAQEVGVRGFDAIVFGHTHLPGSAELANGVRYYNTGAWLTEPWCVAIDHGRIWFGSIAQLLEQGDPFPLDGQGAAHEAALVEVTGVDAQDSVPPTVSVASRALPV
jgi:UDP-2,3-diacylglucosamine pyrophosphatase LpxH